MSYICTKEIGEFNKKIYEQNLVEKSYVRCL